MRAHLFVVAVGLAAGVACKGKDSDTGGDTDTSEPADTDVITASITPTWTATGVTVEIDGSMGDEFRLGMAETGAGTSGWYGEDCVDGQPDGGYTVCHRFETAVGELTSVATPEEVIESNTTLFSESLAGSITYVVFTDLGCWASGNRPTYYVVEQCEYL